MTPNTENAVFRKIKVAAENACWLWLGRVNENGYGYFDLQGKAVRAHRLVYQLKIGPLLSGLEVMHLCHNRLCCNPKHLRLGSHAENMKTRKQKLKPEIIAAIRSSTLNQRVLAEVYGVHQATISRIKSHTRFYKNLR